MAGRKTTCPISREKFRTKAKPISITIGSTPTMVPTKEFSTGSLGWYLNGKTVLEVDGTPVQVQLGLSLTIIGSKELPQEPPVAAAPAPSPTPAPVPAPQPVEAA
jgi:hypothetical protein